VFDSDNKFFLVSLFPLFSLIIASYLVVSLLFRPRALLNFSTRRIHSLLMIMTTFEMENEKFAGEKVKWKMVRL
jgi:hypothetical protein